MKVIHINNIEEKDITELITDISWSGDAKQVARVLSFGIASSSTDMYIPSINIKMGDVIKLLDENEEEKFRGYVFTKEKFINGNQIEITSYDGLIYLIKSKGTYNFKNTTPGNITRRLCKDFNITAGNIINGSPIKRIFDGESLYSIIMTAYTMESNKSKKQYIPLMNKGKLDILEKGKNIATFELDPETSITDAKYGESMEESINVVKMYNDEGKYLGEVKLNGVPGRLQEVYKGEEGEKAARSLLKGIEKTAEIEALGDYECVTGNAVIVKEKYTGLQGLFYIDNDEHSFSNGIHTMTLGLSFKNLMDKQEAGENPDDTKEESNSSTSPNKPNTSKKSTNTNTNKRNKFIAAAESMIGFNYSQANRMGTRSADCSSLVGRAMKKAGLTNNAQLTTRSILNDNRFTRISKSNAKRGDILWERGHMGIYMGGNKTLEARYSTKKVGYSSLGNRFTSAYRIKGID